MKVNYRELYYDREVRVLRKGEKRPMELSIRINDFNGNPDCMVGHFGHNFYYRTKKGLEYGRYESKHELEADVASLLTANGFKVIEWV